MPGVTYLFAGEDIDFPNGHAPSTITTAGFYDSTYSRCAVYAPVAYLTMRNIVSVPFNGGEVTSFWFSCYSRWATSTGIQNAYMFVGIVDANLRGLWIGGTDGAREKVTLYKTADDSTFTVLATEVTSSFSFDTLHRIDVHVVNYGANATVDVYIDTDHKFTYTGDITNAGQTGFDRIASKGDQASNFSDHVTYISQVMVRSVDTRPAHLFTRHIIEEGDTSQWTGAYTDIDEAVINDNDRIFTNTDGADSQYTLRALPAGDDYRVDARRIVARAAISVDSSVETLKIGEKITAGALDLDAGRTVDTGWVAYDRYIDTTQTKAEANLIQLAVRANT